LARANASRLAAGRKIGVTIHVASILGAGPDIADLLPIAL